MTTILVCEGNTPELCEAGERNAPFFLSTLAAIDPTLVFRVACPYEPGGTQIDGAFLKGVDGVIFTGSSVSWATDDARALPQRNAMAAAFAARIPTWGSCNGLQLAATLLGGAVGENPHGLALGLAHNVKLTEHGLAHPMFEGRRAQLGSWETREVARGFSVPCIHRDVVLDLPPAAVVLAGNEHSPVQAFVVNDRGVDFWGTQYHPECSAADISSFLGGGVEMDATKSDCNNSGEGNGANFLKYQRQGGLFRAAIETSDSASASALHQNSRQSTAGDLAVVEAGGPAGRDAARRLGCLVPDIDLAFDARAAELACWLRHVKSRRTEAK